jgi:hypothetical protein
MKHLTAAIVCVTVLYGIDVLFFGGWYYSNATRAIEQAYALRW